MPSQLGLSLLNQPNQPKPNIEETLEFIHDHPDQVVRLVAPGMRCRVRYLGLEPMEGGAQPTYDFFNTASQMWSPCAQKTLWEVLKKYGPYSFEVEDEN